MTGTAQPRRLGHDFIRLGPDPTTLADLRQLVTAGGTVKQADAMCLSLLGLKTTQKRRAAFDPRIAQCLSLIRAGLDQPLRQATLAAVINVSESWLVHRFTDQVGVPFRRYVLWQRLRRAVEVALKGATLTEAAHAAGLSDSAHLSRTFRETFGVAPSFLFEHRDQLEVCFSED